MAFRLWQNSTNIYFKCKNIELCSAAFIQREKNDCFWNAEITKNECHDTISIIVIFVIASSMIVLLHSIYCHAQYEMLIRIGMHSFIHPFIKNKWTSSQTEWKCLITTDWIASASSFSLFYSRHVISIRLFSIVTIIHFEWHFQLISYFRTECHKNGQK